ncbi:hypothetical protein OG689_26190 [Kitasatospora sp. NBC_00240]|uniref:hypothetical protein n=1 Tax=Kitasatospora sp. NBC_00240 TaxID=2903567 RepID=UPI002250E964|nr:hypothetical protein [Kitasatospora sp. NBC_00240]MCX5212731.1 hypothetical protein [Kitasatospora sp. NBC_00240]
MPRSRTGGPTTSPTTLRGARLPLAVGLVLFSLGCSDPTPDPSYRPITAVETLFPGSGGNGTVKTISFPTTSLGFVGAGEPRPDTSGASPPSSVASSPLSHPGASPMLLVFQGPTGQASGQASPEVVIVRGVHVSNTDFEVTEDNCTGATIGAGRTCTVSIDFSPESAGQKTADLSVETSGPDIHAQLTGTAVDDRSQPPPSAVPGSTAPAPDTPSAGRASAPVTYSP